MMNAISCCKYEPLFWLLVHIFTTQQHMFVYKSNMHFSNLLLSIQGQTRAIKHLAELSALVKLPYFPPVQNVQIRLIVIFLFFKKVGNHISNIEH